MRIKLDENLPTRLVPVLSELGHEAQTVYEEGLKGRDDASVWAAAQAEGRFFITQDLDFSDVRLYGPGTHAGLLLLRMGNAGRDALLERMRAVFETEDASEWPGCYVVVSKQKVRVRRPAK